MPQALITIGGTPGSDEDLPINTLVQLDNVNIGGETTFLWTITDQPEGPADALSSTTIQNPIFTPLKEGTYRIRLEVNKGLGDEKIDTVVARVLQLKTREGIPAADETTEAGSKGWKIRVNEWLQLVDTMRADPGLFVAEAGAPLAVLTVVEFSDVVTIKSGLPGEEKLPEITLKNATTADVGTVLLGVVISEVDGTTPIGSGNLAITRQFGLILGVSIPGAIVGDTVFVSDTGTLDRVSGTFQRRVGKILNVPSAGVADVSFNGVGGDAGLASLQTAYVAGNTIAQTSVNGTIIFQNIADDTALMRLIRTFAGTSPALDIVMDAATSGNAIAILENGVAFGLSLKATGLSNENNLSSFGIQFVGADNDYDFRGIANPGVGSSGRLLNIEGAPGGGGDVTTLGGPGAPVVIRAGSAGADGGFGGNAGANLSLRAGAGTGAGADGIVDAGFEDLNVPAGTSFQIGGNALSVDFTQAKMDAILRTPDQVTATGDTTTTSPTDVFMSGMTITPGAGNYFVKFSSSFEHSTNSETINVSLYVGGVQVAHTERQFQRGSGSSGAGLSFEAYVTGVTGGQAIELRWRTSAATATAHERTFVVKQTV